MSRGRGLGLGDIMPGCFTVPQNPFFTPGNCPMFSPGNGFKSGSVPAVGTSSLPTSLPVSSSWLMGGGGGSSVTTITSSITPGSPAATSLPKATTQASPSIVQTNPQGNRQGYGQAQTQGWRKHWGPSIGPSMGNNFIGYKNDSDSKLDIDPSELLQTLPNINLNRPVNLKCEDGGVASWVNQNPMLAGLALVGLFFALNKG